MPYRIEKHPSMKVADRVLALIRLNTHQRFRVSVEPYNNGREQGWCLEARGLAGVKVAKACVAENRNSDDIVLYYGEMGERFTPGSNIPSERAYNDRVMVPNGEYAKAAKYLKNWIVSMAGA